MKIALLVLVLTQMFNLVFVPLFDHAGLALSIGLGASVNALLLLTLLVRRGTYKPGPGWIPFLLRALPALLALGALLYGANHTVNWVDPTLSSGLRITLLLGTIAAAGSAYFAVLFLFGFRLRHFTKRAV